MARFSAHTNQRELLGGPALLTTAFSLISLLFILGTASQANALPQVYTDQYLVFPYSHFSLRSGSAQPSSLPRLVTVGSTTSSRILGGQSLDPVGATEAGEVELYDSEKVSSDCAALLRELGLGVGEGWHCEANFQVQVSALPSDPLLNDQHTLTSINLPQAWKTTTGARSVIVGVLDTGIDYTHPDLAPNMWKNPGEVPNNGIDDDHNGYIDDVHGIDTFSDDSDPMDDNDHGTHCAGIIGARGDNRIGMSGIAWNTQLMALKFLGAHGSGSIFDAIRAIDYAVDGGVDIVNASFGTTYPSVALDNAIQRAERAGVLFVAAAGNAGSNNDEVPEYPASLPNNNIISVASGDREGNLSVFSNYGGRSVDIVAPGEHVLSTVSGGRYARFSGTSMAAPHVSGVAALLLSHNRKLKGTDLKRILLATVKNSPAYLGLVTSSGTLNGAKALKGPSFPGGNDMASSPAPETNRIRISKFRTTASRSSVQRRLRKGRRVKRGGRIRFSLIGEPFQPADLSIVLSRGKESVECTPWQTVLGARGTRRVTFRIPARVSAKKLTIAALPGSSQRTITITGKRKRKKRSRMKSPVFLENCSLLTQRIRSRG
ncbi:S8 family serine peptidase [bacterium]|nr:S8 family serine peptidase [bacterium]